MNYRVRVQPRAQREIYEAAEWFARRSYRQADRWLHGLGEALLTLSEFPGRCALAPESDGFHEPVRQLLYGRGYGAYRLLFIVREQTVHVVAVRHGLALGWHRKNWVTSTSSCAGQGSWSTLRIPITGRVTPASVGCAPGPTSQ